MTPAPGTVAVWIGPAVADPSCCSAAEHDRAARHRNPDSARVWLSARALLRLRIAEATGSSPGAIVLDERPGGKPFARDVAVHVNLSHAAGLVAIAIGAPDVGPVGVDIEGDRRLHRPDRLAGRLLGDGRERDRWFATPEPDRTRYLLQRWTRTEALLKATGEGIGGGVAGAEKRLVAAGWVVRDLTVPDGGFGAVAARGSGWVVQTLASV